MSEDAAHVLPPEREALLHELFRKVGVTLYRAQNWERGMAWVIHAGRASDRRYATKEEADASLHYLCKEPSGRLIQALRREVTFLDTWVVEHWAEVVQSRNYLAHRFFPEHGWDIHTNAGLRRMIADVDGLQAEIRVVEAEVRSVVEQLLENAGQGGAFQAWTDEQIAQAKARDGEL